MGAAGVFVRPFSCQISEALHACFRQKDQFAGIAFSVFSGKTEEIGSFIIIHGQSTAEEFSGSLVSDLYSNLFCVKRIREVEG